MKQLYALLFCPLMLCAQVQIGADLLGNITNNQFGREISISGDGSVVAALGYNEGDDGDFRIYENVNGQWQLYGIDKDGGHFENYHPIGMALSNDGQVIALAKNNEVKVFSYVNRVWTQLGNTIIHDETDENNDFGDVMRLSNDGTTIAIAKPLYFSPSDDLQSPIPPPLPGLSYEGKVEVYRIQNNEWTRIGDPIVGEVTSLTITALDMSSNGNVVAISNSSNVRVYANQSGNWELKGEAFSVSGEKTHVSMSDEGDIVIIGDYFHYNDPDERGKVAVYEFENGTWTPLGQEILSGSSFDYIGYTVDISNNGEIIAFGSFQTDPDEISTVRLYELVGTTWEPLSSPIESTTTNDQFGTVLSLSADGSTIAIGAPLRDNNKGLVQVYDLNGLLSTDSFETSNLSVYPNPSSTTLHIELLNNSFKGQLHISNMLGQVVLQREVASTQLILDVSNWESGMYILRLNTDSGSIVRKVVVE